MKLAALLCASAALFAAPSASAALLTYAVSGTFVDGASLSGSFTFDDAGSSFSQFSNVNIQVNGYDAITRVGAIFLDPKGYAITFQSKAIFDGGSAARLVLPATQQNLALRSITGDKLADTSYYFRPNSLTQYALSSGSITRVPAVPEPASWALFITGFAVVGTALRHRRKATVRFA